MLHTAWHIYIIEFNVSPRMSSPSTRLINIWNTEYLPIPWPPGKLWQEQALKGSKGIGDRECPAPPSQTLYQTGRSSNKTLNIQPHYFLKTLEAIALPCWSHAAVPRRLSGFFYSAAPGDSSQLCFPQYACISLHSTEESHLSEFHLSVPSSKQKP